jgi:CubicO group peptidase (beta-lactamase class C family)
MLFPGRDFEKASCRDASVDKNMLVDMFDKISEDKLNIHSMVLLRDGAKIFDVYAEGFGPTIREEVFSVSKSFTSLAIGICQDMGYLSIDQPVLPFFKNQITQSNPGYEALTIRHLLTMSVGHKMDYTNEWKKGVNVYDLFFQKPLDYPVGTHFVYNSLASFLLSAIVSKVTKKNLNDFLDEVLYSKIGIVKPIWDQVDGISLGGWGLKLSVLDMARFGQLVLNEGSWKNEVIVSRAYVKEATSFQIATTHVENPKDRYGYGYQFWINDFGDSRAAGMFKQYIVTNKEFGLVLAIQAYESKELLDLFTSYILPGFFKGWQYTPFSLRDYLYRFTQDSKELIAEEKKNRTIYD